MDDPALVQITRLLGLPRGSLTTERASDVVAARCQELASALLEELASSDDVVDAASAIAYLEDRIAALRPYLTDNCAAEVRTVIRQTVEGWNSGGASPRTVRPE